MEEGTKMKYLKAFQNAIPPVESLYDSTFDVYGHQESYNPDTGVTESTNDVLVVKGAKGRLTQKPRAGSTAVSDVGAEPEIIYETKLLCSTDVEIPAGARVVVTDIHGNVRDYRRADEGFMSYITHKEVTLIRNVNA